MKFSRLAVNALILVAGSSDFLSFGRGRSLFVRGEDVEASPEIVENETEKIVEYVPPQGAEKFGFQAEVHRMLDIVVNSLYQHKDVFLRELISNASDALDKIRYLTLTNPEQYGSDGDIPLEVQIEYDSVLKTITIRDTGVGMTHNEMVENLGTVARSGTTKFMEALRESGNADSTMSQIGQFGVGFYSAFLVADRVKVVSKSPLDSVQHVWETTNGSSEFFIYADPQGNTLKRGTEITLYLKEDESIYADSSKIQSLAKHYSEFVVHPISVRVTNTVMVDDDEEEEEEEKVEGDDDLEVKDDDDKEDAVKPKKQKEVTTQSWELVNGDPAIWTRDKDEVTDEEYQNFFKVLTGDENQNAADWSHFNAEGNINFKSILYLPEDIPPSYRQGQMEPIKGNVKLYVRKVLIGDEFNFLPKYLGFIRGVVDSDELTLNVNRETLQEEKTLKVIRKKVVKKAIDLIRQFAKESDAESKKDDDDEEATSDDEKSDDSKKASKYIEWYKKFSPNIKLGIIEDYPNRKTLIKLLRFETSKSEGKLISLDEYTKSMKEWQKDIYVLGCVDAKECSASPFLETFRDKDLEVIYMTDAIDEYMVRQVYDFDKKKLIQVSGENVKFDDEDADLIKRREKVYREKFNPLTKWLKKLYQGSVLKVQVAKRSLGSVPAIVTSGEYGNSANMERILKAQAYQHGVDPSASMSNKVFEINPRHPLVLKLLRETPIEEPKGEETIKVPQDIIDAAWMLHDMAMLSGGFGIADTKAHNKRMAKVLQNQFGLSSLTLEPEINPPVLEDLPPEPDDDENDINMDNIGMGGPDLNLNNLNVDELRDRFPDAGWPEKKKDDDDDDERDEL